MAARWSGFAHPHLDVTYSISIGTTRGDSDVVSVKDIGTSTAHKETGLSLTPYQVYLTINNLLQAVLEKFLEICQ